MGATVSYNGNVIHQADDGETFTLNTEGEYMEGDIVVEVDEGGGSTLPSATGVSF